MVFLPNETRKMYRLLRHAGKATLVHCQNMQTKQLVDRRLVHSEDELVGWAEKFNGKGNCFIGRNPREDKDTIAFITSFSLDIDPIRDEGQAATKEMIDKALFCGKQILEEVPNGSLLFSGNGVQIIYSWDVFQDKKLISREKCKEFTQKFMQKYSNDHLEIDPIFDPERLIKLAGTLSTKGEQKDWKVTKFLTYSLKNAENVALELTSESISKPVVQISADNLGYKSRSEADYGLASFLKNKGLSREQVLAALKENPVGRNQRVDDHYRIIDKLFGNTINENYSENDDIESFLKDEQEVKWICPGFFAEKSIAFVAGLPETMKTWMLIDLAIECARGGGMWLKKFPVNKAKVLFIDQERFKGETQRRFKAVIAGKEISSADLQGNLFIKCGSTIRLDLEQSFSAFRKQLQEVRPDLVIVDSFATFHTREENNRKDIQEVLEKIKLLRTEIGCTFIFIDHENKGVFNDKENSEEPSAFRMVGSIAKPAAAETVLTVRRQDAMSSFVYHTKSTLATTCPNFIAKVVDLLPDRTKIAVEGY